MNKLRLTSKSDEKQKTIIDVKGVKIGEELTIIAGPCSVETEAQVVGTALEVKKGGANILRGGAFKPRTSPYDFQGLGLAGLKLLKKAGIESGLPIITEVIDPRDVSWVCEYADIVQIGARNMQNFSLLQEVGRADKPVLLKRGMHSTLSEWLNCAEYILSEGNPNVILCERGIRTFETYTRNTLDLGVIPSVRNITHLPIVVDPSHGTGRRELVEPMSLAAIAAGADGLIIETHICPDEARCDGAQSLTPEMFAKLVTKLHIMDKCVREINNLDQ